VTSETTSGLRQPGYVVAGKYRVDRILGEGGMGVVVAATHTQLDQKVALKFLLPELLAQTEVVQRFMREARAAVKIQSEHVARVLDVGSHDGAPYMVMEYLEGSDLSQLLEARGALPCEEAVGYVLEACEAIAEAHALAIIHRDLKPANLFLAARPGGRPMVKVLDFGISKAPATGIEAQMTRTSATMGSPAYMSPEQMASASSVDARSDIWSLGIVLYEMLVMKLPFAADTMPGLVVAILQDAPVPIGTARPDVPVGLQRVISRCLEKIPANRYANVAELARALLPFAPPRSEQSVERIEHVLGQPADASRVRISGSQPRTNIDAHGAAFAPTTSLAGLPRRSRFIAPVAGIVVGGVAVAMFLTFRTPKVAPSASSSIAPTPSSATPASAPLALTAPSEPDAAATATTEASAVPSAAPKPSGHLYPFAPRPSAGPAAAAPTATPTCKTVSYFDADGNKHFKQVCP
jgi:serine/threonine protein kinase